MLGALLKEKTSDYFIVAFLIILLFVLFIFKGIRTEYQQKLLQEKANASEFILIFPDGQIIDTNNFSEPTEVIA